ncbi:MAG: DUF262 domain-containing protein [Hyphomicrobiales bacterium]|nr:DUF262 domain-containing protein [Hyphomicrobiales bacterium]
MPASFETHQVTLENLLSGRSIYFVPPFQRPYSWECANANQLLDDLQNRFENRGDDFEAEFFLGSVILFKTSAESYHIIDGQQRLLTTCMIVAIIRDMIADEKAKEELQNLLWAQRRIAGGAGQPRFQTRKTENELFQSCIINMGGNENMPRRASTEAGNRIIAVTNALRSALTQYRGDVSGFLDHMLGNSELIKITASSIESGYNLFRNVNSPGQKLSDFDIVRAELIGPRMYDQELAVDLSNAWSRLEETYGSKELARYIRAVGLAIVPDGYKMDLIPLISKIHRSPRYKESFYEKLQSFFRNYQRLAVADLDFGPDSRVINKHVKCLTHLTNDNWRPLALLWMTRPASSRDSFRFFQALDALFHGLLVLSPRSTDVGKRAQIISNRIHEGTALDAGSPLYLAPEEKQKIKEILWELYTCMTLDKGHTNT